jgi:hypothetical protein
MTGGSLKAHLPEHDDWGVRSVIRPQVRESLIVLEISGRGSFMLGPGPLAFLSFCTRPTDPP